jgi:predicted unusual protein kinase regulating ubiquinone biosynthesis (AarF/ABC1/UbiB family)
MSRKPVTTRTGRFFRLAGMTSSVATSYATRKARGWFSEETEESRHDYYNRMAEEIVDTLGELKGAVMKVGQIASQTQDFLPRELTDALQRLQKEAPAMDYEVIKDQIESELGDRIENLFAEVDETPYAAASIGQVHRARLNDGREVVVKVQYPGVDRSCDSDLRQLRTALRLGGLLKMPKETVDELFNEVRDRLHEELDYENEARNIEQFAQQHRDDHWLLIPDVVHERSSRRVLTMEKVEGDHISEVTRERYDQDTINLIGQRIFQAMADGLFRHRAIHGDPHAGNFAYRPDGTIILYDFGCIKNLRPSTVEAYRNCVIDALNENYQSLDQHLIHLGARVEDHPPVDPDYYAMWRNILYQPFAPENQPYDFAQSDLHQQVAANTHTVFKHLNAFKPPVESILIDRMVAGHYWMLKRLGVKADFRPLLEEYIKKEETAE